jgi:hypothetical protein
MIDAVPKNLNRINDKWLRPICEINPAICYPINKISGIEREREIDPSVFKDMAKFESDFNKFADKYKDFMKDEITSDTMRTAFYYGVACSQYEMNVKKG